jgi:NAD(P)-dependent dehydrogenase (short-subunit alcohol dehydrogenase family)
MTSSRGSVLVTGANGGLGSAIVSSLIQKPELTAYMGIFPVRSQEAATQLRSVLLAAPKGYEYEIVEVDHGSIASVKALATQINARVLNGTLPPIRALILCAAYQDGTVLVGNTLKRS